MRRREPTISIAKLKDSTLKLSDIEGCSDGAWLQTHTLDTGRFHNASGAGDCAVAAFLSALLNDENIITAGRYAMIAGRDNLFFASIRLSLEIGTVILSSSVNASL